MVHATRLPLLFALLVHCCLVAGWAQAPPAGKEVRSSAGGGQANPVPPPNGTPAEAYVIQDFSQRIKFENDGTGTRDTQERIQVLSDAGVQRWGVLSFSYQNFNQVLDIDYVRVKKANGTVVVTPLEEIQEITSEISRVAPFYTDQREKHVAVKGLAPGDVLEYSSHLRVTKPLAPGQFWMEYEFDHDEIITQETLEISIPAGRAITIKNRGPKPEILDQGGRRIYHWSHSNPKRHEETNDDETQAWKLVRGRQDQPDILLSSFVSWDEVGGWYEQLERERVRPTAEIQAKTTELTKGAPDDMAKLRALYTFVSTRYRYIGVAFGVGRYQPHFAAEVLDNAYGDCKDKHTLLASLLMAAGFKVYPVLISSQRDIDPDVPSPGQFNHVIGVVVLGDRKIWLDTTPEVSPFGFLMGPLRGKRALLVRPDSTVLETTPENPGLKSSQTFVMKAKLDDSGVLTGEAEFTFAGDDVAVGLRSSFRSVPMPQWKELAQRICYASGFGGEVSDVHATPPEDLSQPFRFSYKYTRKDYTDWGNRRISPPLPLLALPDIKEGKKTPSAPLFLSVPGEIHFHSTLELPKSYTLEVPQNINVKQDLGEYHAEYSLEDGVLTTDRRLAWLVSEVPVSAYQKYKDLRQRVVDDRDMMIQLSSTSAPKRLPSAATAGSDSPAATMAALGRSVWLLPSSSDSVAVQYENDAHDAAMRQDFEGAISSLRSAVNKDPKFVRAWLLLGSTFDMRSEREEALDAYRSGVNADPTQAVSYKLLGFTLMRWRKFEEAVAVWKSLQRISPEDNDAATNLGLALLSLKRYREAMAALEPAAKRTPDKTSLQLALVRAYLGAGDGPKAHSALQQAIKLDPSPAVLNSVAYILAEQNADLAAANEYSETAVRQEEEAAGKLGLDAIKATDMDHARLLAAYWDTLGWVYFRRNDLERAQKYLAAAWAVSQDGVIGRHLGQVYEKQGKKSLAIHVYQLAHAANPPVLSPVLSRRPAPEDPDNDLQRLGAKPDFVNAISDLNKMRTFALPRIVSGTASANFYVLFSPGGKIEAKFVSGADPLKVAETRLAHLNYKFAFPDDGPTRIARNGMLACYAQSGCSFVFLPPPLRIQGLESAP